MCINIEFNLTLISKVYHQTCYSNQLTYFMLKNKRLKYINIEIDIVTFTKCVNINVRFQTLKNEFVEIKTQIHIISKLKYNIILKIFTFKLNNIILF